MISFDSYLAVVVVPVDVPQLLPLWTYPATTVAKLGLTSVLSKASDASPSKLSMSKRHYCDYDRHNTYTSLRHQRSCIGYEEKEWSTEEWLQLHNHYLRQTCYQEGQGIL
jgi:hypothetical protein